MRWNAWRVARGLPALPVPDVEYSRRPHAVEVRGLRDIARRMEAFDGVRLDWWSARVRAAYRDLVGDSSTD